MPSNIKIVFYERKKLRFETESVSEQRFTDDCVAGPTLYSLISAGTEINGTYLDVFDWGYPRQSGYAGVMRVDFVGKNVKGISPGDIVFGMLLHQSYQTVPASDVVRLPDGVAPQDALFARLAGVSMATLSRTLIRPGELVLVTGLGCVGLLAAEVYSNLGYTVIASDPDAGRVAVARECGIVGATTSVPKDDERYRGKIGLALECSGNESAVLDCCEMVRLHGEVSVVGVPWKQRSDTTAFAVLNRVFYNYIMLYSGWEMDLPLNSNPFSHSCMRENYTLALQMIADGRVRVSNLFRMRKYCEAQEAYDSIYQRTEIKPTVIFDWRGANQSC